VKDVACKLGNKPATCKKYYIHPAIIDCYSAGNLRELAEKFRESSSAHLYEQIVLSVLTPVKRARAKAA
jgi:DNA topoisomerase IB